MSTKVKERLKKIMIDLNHEERIELDNMLDQIYMKMGGIIVKEERGCDKLIEEISDDNLRDDLQWNLMKKGR